MKAAVVYETNTPLQVVEIETTAMGEDDILVRMGAAGLCHSDVSVQTGDLPWPVPMILGHEGAGTVEKVGARVTNVQPGDHVALAAVMNCGRCRYCSTGQPTLCAWGTPYMFESLAPNGPERALDPDGRAIRQMCCLGTIAEQVVVPGVAAIKIPKDVPFSVAAIAGCAVTTGLGAVFNRAKVQAGSTVAVIGTGGVGLNAVQGAKIAGARMVIAIDPTPAKRELALELGATHALDPADGDAVAEVVEMTGGIGADSVMESVGRSETLLQAWDMAGRDGIVVSLGVPDPTVTVSLPITPLTMGHKTLTGCMYGGGRPHQDLPVYLEMYKNGQLRLDELVTTTYTIEGVNDAIEDLHQGKNARGVFQLS